MPDLAALIGGLPPLWVVAALLVLVLVACAVAVRRYGSTGSAAALFGVPALVVIAWSAWNFAEHAILRQRAAEREALNARALQLATNAMVPGSALACLDAAPSEAVEASCEAAVFAKPETVAAATVYTEARLRLLADSVAYVRRVDRSYAAALNHLRRGLETDRYGFVAHVLATRDGCTADACDGFALLRDASTVKANISTRALNQVIARHALNWPEHKAASAAAAPFSLVPPPVATMSTVPVTRPIDFPTAASIPPVSIMTDPPAAAAAPAARPAPGTPAPPVPAAAAKPQ